MLFSSKNDSKEGGRPASSFVNEPWYMDLQKLTNEELMRMYTMISDGHYRFAKNAWYIPIEKDHRCPIMVAKGYRSPDTLDRMAEFQDTADRKSTRLNSSHANISYAVFCLKKKNIILLFSLCFRVITFLVFLSYFTPPLFPSSLHFLTLPFFNSLSPLFLSSPSFPSFSYLF